MRILHPKLQILVQVLLPTGRPRRVRMWPALHVRRESVRMPGACSVHWPSSLHFGHHNDAPWDALLLPSAGSHHFLTEPAGVYDEYVWWV
jgi:hypothetical protein